MNSRQCVACFKIQDLVSENFQASFDKFRNKTYFKHKCKVCERKCCRQYHESNKHKILIRKRKYESDHAAERKEYRKKYNQTAAAKEKNRAKANKRYHERKNKPEYKLRRSVSLSINKQLKRLFSNKNKKSITKYLPYSISDLKEYLERQFEPWMNWGNYGAYRVNFWNDNDKTTWAWHIDHIKPHSTFNYLTMEADDFKKCWDLANLRPYSAKQNIIDGATRVRHKI